MWIVDAISAIVGPTVGKFFEVIISSFFGIFILLWNFSPVALIIFVLVLYGLYKLSDKLGTLVLGFGAAYAAYHFGHPIIACIIILAVFENLFSSSGKSSSESGNRQKKQIDATPKNPIPDGPDDSHPTVFSPCDGTVLSIGVEPGIRVDGSQVVLIIVINRTMKAELVPGDVVQAGFVISNSEIGLGALKVEPLLYRLVCKNGLISKELAHKKYHAGRQVEDTDNAYELYSDETLAADDKAYFLKVQDIVSAAVDEARFNLTVDKMRASMDIHTGDDPFRTVEVLGDKYVLNKAERASILRHFIMGNDFSAFGLVNAVTHSSQEVGDYDRATELERMGGTLLEESVNLSKGMNNSPFLMKQAV